MVEAARGLGPQRAVLHDGEHRDVVVGDGCYLMMRAELCTAVVGGSKPIAVPINDHGYASTGVPFEPLGSQQSDTKYCYRDQHQYSFDLGEPWPNDVATHAESLGVGIVRGARESTRVGILQPPWPGP